MALEYGVGPEYIIYSAIRHAITENRIALRAETEAEVASARAQQAEFEREFEEPLE